MTTINTHGTVYVTANATIGNAFNFTVDSGRSVINVSGENPILRTDRGDIELNKLLMMVQKAEAILCLIEADMSRLAKYPALEQAYENYKVIDALCRDDDA